jgi:anti-anti-sigma factor
VSEFTCQVIREGSAAILKVAGHITYAEVAEFEAQAFTAAAAKPAVFVLDMSDVSVMSSAGIGALLKLDVKLRAQKCPFRIAAAKPTIADVFRLARLDGVFKIVPTVEEALQ